MEERTQQEIVAETAQQLLRAYASGRASHPERIDALKGGLLQSCEGVIYGHHASVAAPEDLGPAGLAPRTLHPGLGAWDVGITNQGGQKQDLFIDPEGVYFGKDARAVIDYFNRPDLKDWEHNSFIYSAELPLRHCDLDPEEIYLTATGYHTDVNPFDEYLEEEGDIEKEKVGLLTEAGVVWDELVMELRAVIKEKGRQWPSKRELTRDGVESAHIAWKRLPYAKQRILVSAAQELDNGHELSSLVYKRALKNIEPNKALMMIREAQREGLEDEWLSHEDIMELVPKYSDIAVAHEQIENMPGAEYLGEYVLDIAKEAFVDGEISSPPDLQDVYEHGLEIRMDEEDLMTIIKAAERESIKLDLRTYELDNYPALAQLADELDGVELEDDLGQSLS